MTVYLVGAGPGDPGLLTVRAVELLARADAVLHDRLIDSRVIALIPPSARRVDVGKQPGRGTQHEINDLLVSLGRTKECVVRLKGGDPFVFGRGGEEVEVLRGAGVDVEVVPGITSAFSGPLLAGIPVTHRGLSQGVCVVTAVTTSGPVDFRPLANPALTLVVLMGVAARARVAAELIAGGLRPTTPVAVIERASTPDQRTARCLLSELGDLDVVAPAVLVIGEVAALALGAWDVTGVEAARA